MLVAHVLVAMRQIDYEDFDLDLDVQGSSLSILVRSRAGEVGVSSRLDPTLGGRFQAFLHRRPVPEHRAEERRRAIDQLRDMGEELSAAVFVPPVRELFLRRCDAIGAGAGLRFVIRADAPELFASPWELVVHPTTHQFLGLSIHTPVVRRPRLPHANELPVPSGPLRLLGQVVSPSDAPALDVATERRSLEAALDPLAARGRISIAWAEAGSVPALARAFRRHAPHVFHFAGHGGSDAASGSYIRLAQADGQTEFLTCEQLAHLCATSRELRLVVLNTCRGADFFNVGRDSAFAGPFNPCGGMAQALLAGGVGAVAAMQAEISDRAALEFAATFYRGLADGVPVDAAMAEARLTLFLQGAYEFAIPVLYMRSPFGALLAPRAEPTATALSGPGAPHRRPARVFIISAPDDEAPLRRLEAHLAVMRRAGLIEVWTFGNLGFGDAEVAMKEKLQQADIVLLLVTPRLHAADAGHGTIETAIAEGKRRRQVLIPLLVTPCHTELAPYAHLTVLPRDRRFIASHADPDAAWAEVAMELHAFVDSMNRTGSAS